VIAAQSGQDAKALELVPDPHAIRSEISPVKREDAPRAELFGGCHQRRIRKAIG
jgi:hypothetical protein